MSALGASDSTLAGALRPRLSTRDRVAPMNPSVVCRAVYLLIMANEPLPRGPRLFEWICRRSTLFWAIAITVVLVAALFVSSQIAHDRHQSVDWYTGFGQWLGALASFVAAGAALWIATRDREYRALEQRAEQEAHARLIVVSLDQPGGSHGYFPVGVSNFGTRAVLDVAFDTATSDLFPSGTRAKIYDEASREIAILDCDRSRHQFSFAFVDEESDEPVLRGKLGSLGVYAYDPIDLSGFEAWIRFRDADGVRWRRSSSGKVERL